MSPMSKGDYINARVDSNAGAEKNSPMGDLSLHLPAERI